MCGPSTAPPPNHPRTGPAGQGGKKFALTITHDVEGAQGVGKIDQLVALEMKLGFRSSFNFVPEGETEYSARNCAPSWLGRVLRWGCTIFTTTGSCFGIVRSLPGRQTH